MVLLLLLFGCCRFGDFVVDGVFVEGVVGGTKGMGLLLFSSSSM